MDHITTRVNWTVTIVCSIALLVIGGAAGGFLVYSHVRDTRTVPTAVPVTIQKPSAAVKIKADLPIASARPSSAPAFSHVYPLRNGETRVILNETYGHVDVDATDPVRIDFGSCHDSKSFSSFRFGCEGAPSMITITDARAVGAPASINEVHVELRF